MDYFSCFLSLFSDKNKKQIVTLIEKVMPYLHQEWQDIQPKLRVLIRRGRPSTEEKVRRLVVEIENVAKTVDKDFSDSVKETLSGIELAFSFIGSTVHNVVSSNSKVNDFFKGFSKSAAEVESVIVKEINSLESERNLLFDNLCKFENMLNKIEHNFPEFDFEIMSYSKSEHFRDSMINNCNQSKFKKERVCRIEEILDLHCLGFYGGSVALLYSQIEGVITDTLIETGHVKIKRNQVVVHLDSQQTLPGLNKKMEYTENNLASLEDVFNKLSAAKISDGERERSISQSRNIVLHGNFVELSDKSHSLSLLLSLYVIILKVRLMSDN